MNHFKKLSDQLIGLNILYLLLSNAFAVGGVITMHLTFGMSLLLATAVVLPLSLIVCLILSKMLVDRSLRPLKAVWQAVWHISPNGKDVPTPDLQSIKQGHDLVNSMTQQIYDLASHSNGQTPAATVSEAPNEASFTGQALLEYMPLPVISLDNQLKIVFVNRNAAEYLGSTTQELAGKPLYDFMRMSFTTSDTLEEWLKTTRSTKVTAFASWDHVRFQASNDKGLKQFDMVAHYTKDNPGGYETLLALFDRTDKYASEDSKSSYVALAVHELRAPLTLLRGYIEVFEDELGDKLTPELKDFMYKMQAAAQTLTAFVSNILNVARVDENQLTLSLREGNWNELLPEICRDLELRVKVHGKELEFDIAPNLPTIAVDKISIYEVVSNLIENATKYSGDSKKITIHANLSQDGNVETIVQDYGIGIPASTIPNLFTKYFRSHKSKGQVGGSGLGLYLVKAIISAHGGNVWVRSKEGEGSSFGFTLRPYASVAEGLKSGGSGAIERQANGWIKNHSMYRK